MLEFEVLGDRNKFIDIQRTRLEKLARILQNNVTVLHMLHNQHMLQRWQAEIRRILLTSLYLHFFLSVHCREW